MLPELLFETNLQIRRRMLSVLENTPADELNHIPDGYRNNIWWNMAHMVVTQQLLCYKLSGLPMQVEKEFIKRYSKGSVPGERPDRAEVDQLRGYLILTVEQLKSDYEQGIFKGYSPYTTSADVTLGSIEDALLFNLVHEGIHLGVITSLQKVTGAGAR